MLWKHYIYIYISFNISWNKSFLMSSLGWWTTKNYMLLCFFVDNNLFYEIGRDGEFHFTDNALKCSLGLIQDKTPGCLNSLGKGPDLWPPPVFRTQGTRLKIWQHRGHITTPSKSNQPSWMFQFQKTVRFCQNYVLLKTSQLPLVSVSVIRISLVLACSLVHRYIEVAMINRRELKEGYCGKALYRS